MTGFHTKKRENMGITWVTYDIYYTSIYIYLNNLWLHKFSYKVLLLNLCSPRKPGMLDEQFGHMIFKLCSLIRTFDDFFKWKSTVNKPVLKMCGLCRIIQEHVTFL